MSLVVTLIGSVVYGFVDVSATSLGKALILVNGEVAHWGHSLVSADLDTWFLVVMSGLCGASLGYVGLRTQQLMSGTTVLVMQNFNKLLIISLGMFLFHEHMTALSLLGCLVSLP